MSKIKQPLYLHDQIIHFGQSLNDNIYDHNIDKKIWELLLLKISQNVNFTNKCVKKTYKIYHYENLVYEFDLDNNYQCFTDIFDSIQKLILVGNETNLTTSLVYKRKRFPINSFFQPINRYYNIHELERSIYANDDFDIIFEKKNNQREIKIIIHLIDIDDNSNKLDKLKSIIQFDEYYFQS